MLICMRTTLNLNADIYHEAVRATGITEKTKLIHLGLESLIQREAHKRLAQLYGKIPKAQAPQRRKIQK